MRTTRRKFFTAAAGAAAIGVATVAGRTPGGPNQVIVQVGDTERTLSQDGIDEARETAYEEFLDVGNDQLDQRVAVLGDTSETIVNANLMTADGVPYSFEGSATTAAEADLSRGRAFSWARDVSKHTGAPVELHDVVRDSVTEYGPGRFSRLFDFPVALGSSLPAAMADGVLGAADDEEIDVDDMNKVGDKRFEYPDEPYGVVSGRIRNYFEEREGTMGDAVIGDMSLEPGAQAFDGGDDLLEGENDDEGNNGWQTVGGGTVHDWGAGDISGIDMQDWSPKNTTPGFNGQTTSISASIGVNPTAGTSPTAGASASVSYSKSWTATEPEVRVKDESSDYNELAKWTYEFNGGDPQWDTQRINPGSIAAFDSDGGSAGDTIVALNYYGLFYNECADTETESRASFGGGGSVTECIEDTWRLSNKETITYY